MLNTSESILRKLIFHRVSQNDSTNVINNELTSLDNEEQAELLKKIMLAPFVPGLLTYEFYHSVDQELNVLFSIVRNIYGGKDFKARSKEIYRHLQEVSKHPGIKDGDLFIGKFDDIQLNNKYYEGLVICKIESQDSFIEVKHTRTSSELKLKKGITERKVDKACLIIFDKEPYTLFVIDKVSVDAAYWVDEFIKIIPKNDGPNNTGNLLNITRRFISEQISTEFETSRKDQIEYLNRAAEYFKNNDEFTKSDFERKVFHYPEIIKSFNVFDKRFRQENDLPKTDTFSISKDVVKKHLKGYKSILKLDRNFHIYIHGDKDMIERGVEKDGRKYYKIYYENET